MRMIIALAITALLVLVLLGYVGGTREPDQTGTVTWSQSAQTWKSSTPETRMRVRLPSGEEVFTTSAYTPPPANGAQIVLEVRKNLFGWRSYSWQPGRTPAP